MIYGVLLIVGIFVVPLVLLIWFVTRRANKRREARAASWGELAQAWGGTFAMDRVACARGTHELHLEAALVSVMQASGSPYWSDGGTFTKASLRSARQIGASPAPTAVVMGEFAQQVPEAAQLSGFARIVIEPQGLAIVMDGSVTDLAQLHAAFTVLEAAERIAATNGPFAIHPGR